MELEMKSLDELCEMSSGGTPRRSKPEFYEGGDILWAKIGDLETSGDGVVYDTQEKITLEGLGNINNRFFEKGTLLLAMYGSVGKTAFVGVPMATNQAILGIRIKDESSLSYLYLNYWFKTIKESLLNRAVGGTLQNISLTIVKKLKIPLPPLPEQERIAEILDTADKLRAKDKALISAYDKLTQSLFLEMFGDPVTNPMGWEKSKLSDVCNKITDGTHKTPKYQDEGVIFLSAKNVKRYELNSINPKYISQEEHIELTKRCKVELGDIILTKSGSLGMSAMNKLDFEFSIFESLALIKYDREGINGNYLLYFLNTPSTQFQYLRMTKGVGVKHLHLKDIRGIDFTNPPITLQNKFAERVEQIEKQKNIATQNAKKSEELFGALLQKAFKGEL